MKGSVHISAFDQMIQQEIDEAWLLLRNRKREIQSIMEPYLAAEKEIQIFLDQYAIQFHADEIRRTELKRQIWERTIRQASQEIEPPEDAYFEAFHIERDTSQNILPEMEDQRTADDLNDLRIEDFQDPNVPVVSDTASIKPPEAVPEINPKKQVADDLRWIYHPRTHAASHFTEGDPASKARYDFYQDRAKDLTDIVKNDELDEIDLLMRMRFDAEDERLWHSPIPKGSGEGKGQRLYRLRLWGYLLQVGVQRAQNYSLAAITQRYPAFKAWKDSGVTLLAHFQQVRFRLSEEIDDLKKRLSEISDT